MAFLTKPLLQNVPAWDVENGYSFRFRVVGGDVIKSSILVIRDNETNVVVLENEDSNPLHIRDFINEVPANASGLENGHYYNAYLVTKNGTDRSVQSDTIQFYCYTTPQFEIINPTFGTDRAVDINTSNIWITLLYNQDEGELLDNYTINLYNSSLELISTSGTIFTDKTLSPPNNFTYQIQGLSNNTSYYVDVHGVTVEGTYIIIPQIRLNVFYVSPESYSRLTLSNNCKEGYIYISSSLMLIEGTSNPIAPIYIDDSSVDLREAGNYVDWNQGYSIPDDFAATLWIKEPNYNNKIVSFYDSNGATIEVYLMDSVDDAVNYFYIYLKSSAGYNIYSADYLKTDNTIILHIVRKDNVMDISA